MSAWETLFLQEPPPMLVNWGFPWRKGWNLSDAESLCLNPAQKMTGASRLLGYKQFIKAVYLESVTHGLTVERRVEHSINYSSTTAPNMLNLKCSQLEFEPDKPDERC